MERKKVKLSLFADDIILYIENPEDTTKKLLEQINKFSKVAGYNINIQESVVFLYTNKEWGKQTPLQLNQKHKIPWNKTNQGSKRSVLGKL